MYLDHILGVPAVVINIEPPIAPVTNSPVSYGVIMKCTLSYYPVWMAFSSASGGIGNGYIGIASHNQNELANVSWKTISTAAFLNQYSDLASLASALGGCDIFSASDADTINRQGFSCFYHTNTVSGMPTYGICVQFQAESNCKVQVFFKSNLEIIYIRIMWFGSNTFTEWKQLNLASLVPTT